jgi:hypothetical protein
MWPTAGALACVSDCDSCDFCDSSRVRCFLCRNCRECRRRNLVKPGEELCKILGYPEILELISFSKGRRALLLTKTPHPE